MTAGALACVALWGGYEASYRSEWLQKTLTLNGNVFYYDYTNRQVAFDEELDFTGAGTGLGFPMSYILNAESSHDYGAEIEARWRPISPLQLYASLGLMRTEFDSFTSPVGDLSGNEFPDAPAYTIAAGGMYKDRSGWFAGANMRHTDGYYSGGDLANSPLRFVDGYTTVDVRTGWEWGALHADRVRQERVRRAVRDGRWLRGDGSDRRR